MLNQSRRPRILIAGFALAVLLGCATTDVAQSGRKVRSSAPAPVSTPEPTPTPTPAASSVKSKPRLTLLVGLDRYDSFANIPLYAYDGVLRNLSERLADAPSVRVGAGQSDMSRSDAIQKAKAETEAFVVWIRLRDDSMNRDTRNRGNLDNIVIEYSVFAPHTAKQTTSGQTYTQMQRNRGILTPRTSSIYGDRYLNLAAQEAADRILAHFQIHAPPTRGP
jgi:hypothetical protein